MESKGVLSTSTWSNAHRAAKAFNRHHTKSVPVERVGTPVKLNAGEIKYHIYGTCVFHACDGTVHGRLHIITVFIRLSTFLLWQLAGLKLVSEKEQEKLIKKCAIKGNDTTNGPASSGTDSNGPDDPASRKDTDNDKERKGNGKADRSTREEGASDNQGNNYSATFQRSLAKHSIVLEDAVHVQRKIFSARYQGRACVVKVNSLQRTQREHRRYTALAGHPFVACVLCAAQINDDIGCLVLPHYSPLPHASCLADVVSITRQLLTVLTALHEEGLVHGDIKNDNIVWDETERCIKLIDFETCVRAPSGVMFKTNCGTEIFKAPELVSGQWAGALVDVYAAGLVCGAMMYRGQVRDKETRDFTLAAIAESFVPDSAHCVAPQLFPILERMLAERQHERISAPDALRVLDSSSHRPNLRRNLPRKISRARLASSSKKFAHVDKENIPPVVGKTQAKTANPGRIPLIVPMQCLVKRAVPLSG